MDINSDVALLKGVGEKTLYSLNQNNIYTISDLVLGLPKKYNVYKKYDLKTLKEDTKVIVSGELLSIVVTKYRFKNELVIIYLKYNNSKLKCVLFNQGYLKYQLRKNQKVSICGTYYPYKKELVGTYLIKEERDFYIDIAYGYKDLKSGNVQKFIKNAYSGFNVKFDDKLPAFLKTKYKLLDYNDYIYLSHFPTNLNDLHQINRRMKYDAFLNYSIGLRILEDLVFSKQKSKRNVDLNKLKDFIDSFPFEFTDDQKNAVNDIYKDIISNNIMNRLVEGDVGSGKTAVAMCAMFMELITNRQAALMAPTEILAKQHFKNIDTIFKKFGFKTALLTSDLTKFERESIIHDSLVGKIDIIVSTQAILYHKNIFNHLGIIVIDEQHRFGVEQRSKLLDINPDTDAIYLTATPIPRTLGLTQIGDLTLSQIHTKPSGRKKIETNILAYDDLYNMKDKIKSEIDNGHQIFVIANKIDEDENKYDLAKAYELFNELCPEAKIEKINGRLKEETKNQIMLNFSQKKFDILIATTVIEVGIDIENATMMFILDSENFGLSTLHQLRGRVGRNSFDSYCYLVTNDLYNKRLNILKDTNDCFELAEQDFKLRGPGDFLGVNQSGFTGLDFDKDYAIYECALKDSKELLDKYPNEEIVKEISSQILNKKLKLN